jgi:RHS repeat-associated protein
VAKLNGSGNKIGPNLVLKVMSQDKLNLAVKAFYRPQGSAGGTANVLGDVLTTLATGIVGTIGEVKGTVAALSNTSTSPIASAIQSFIDNNPTPSNKPKAYLHYVFLDDQFNVQPNSGSIPVGEPDVLNNLAISNLIAPKNGFVYIYVSNETQNWDVFFDNLQVVHDRGALLEETHYYPFGLTMVGISSKAAEKLNNAIRFNGKELNEDLDLDWYEYGFRNNYDPQLGRFHSVDPLSTDYPFYAPYQFAGNEVPNAIDLDGLEPAYINPRDALYEYGAGIASAVGQGIDYIKGWFKSKTEVTDRNDVKVSTSETTTTVQTDFRGYFNTLRSAGPDGTVTNYPIVKVETTTSEKVETKKEVQVGVGKVTVKASADGSKEIKAEATFPVGKVPATATLKKSTDQKTGENKSNFELGTGTSNTKVKAMVEVKNTGGSTQTSVGVGLEYKKGSVKQTTSFGISF